MSEEYDNTEFSYTPFWPLVIFLGGFAISAGYQLYTVNTQRVALSNQFQAAVPTITQAQGATSKLYAVAQDLIKTAAKDPYAAQIVKEANIQIKAPAGGTNAAPAAPSK